MRALPETPQAPSPIKPTASVAKVCELIRKGIQDGVHSGGSWIREVAIAERARVSRTSVRQALNVLAAEGFVELHANRGALVVDWNDKNIIEAFELRAMVEAYGCELAAKHRTKQDVEALRREADRFSELISRSGNAARAARGGDADRAAIAECDNRFHRVILGAAGNPRIASLLSAVVQAPLMTKTFLRYDKESLQRSAMHHHDLAMAIAAGDGEWAHATMRVHVLAAKHLLFGQASGRKAAE